MTPLILVITAYTGLSAAWMPTNDLPETKRWLPGTLPVRGVNLDSQFVVEPWMANDEWNNVGYGGTASEFDCEL